MMADYVENQAAIIMELRQRLSEVEAEREAYKRDFEAELEGNGKMRERLGARPEETMFTFVDRLVADQERMREALRDCVDAMEAMIGKREAGFAIEEIADAGRAALSSTPTPEHK